MGMLYWYYLDRLLVQAAKTVPNILIQGKHCCRNNPRSRHRLHLDGNLQCSQGIGPVCPLHSRTTNLLDRDNPAGGWLEGRNAVT